MTDPARSRKEAAVQFLQLVVAGRIEEAYRKHVDMEGKHHNPFFPAGFSALRKAMIENHVQFPNKQIAVKNVLGDGDLVPVQTRKADGLLFRRRARPKDFYSTQENVLRPRFIK